MRYTKPLSVAVAVVRRGNKFLLIKRRPKGTFPNLWALPGGKIEHGEHVAKCITREVEEETGLKTRFLDHAGIVSEHVREGKKRKHFILHICSLSSGTWKVEERDEGRPEWFTREQIDGMRDRIVPSDYFIIDRVVYGKKFYWESEISVSKGKHRVTRFD